MFQGRYLVALVLETTLVGGLLISRNLVPLIGTLNGVVLFSKHSDTNTLYCSWQSLWMLRTVAATSGFKMSCVSNIRMSSGERDYPSL